MKLNGFQWLRREQIWPFEKAQDGKTLYCKEVYIGTVPNSGGSYLHGIENFSSLFLVTGAERHVANNFWRPVPLAYPSAIGSLGINMNSTHVGVETNADWSGHGDLVVRLIYTKTA